MSVCVEYGDPELPPLVWLVAMKHTATDPSVSRVQNLYLRRYHGVPANVVVKYIGIVFLHDAFYGADRFVNNGIFWLYPLTVPKATRRVELASG